MNIITRFSLVYSSQLINAKKDSSPNVGLEPTTLRLRVSCSTDWASRAIRHLRNLFENSFSWRVLCCLCLAPWARRLPTRNGRGRQNFYSTLTPSIGRLSQFSFLISIRCSRRGIVGVQHIKRKGWMLLKLFLVLHTGANRKYSFPNKLVFE